MLAMIAGAVLGGVSAYGQAKLASANAKANNRISEANAAAETSVRGAGNAFAAAKGSLARYMQSLGNNQTLDAGGEALEANLVSARRHEDTMLQGSFEEAIRDAEQSGAQAAAAAFAGVAGEVSDTVSVATRLSQQRAVAEARRNTNFRTYDAAQRAGVIMSQTIRGLDSSLIFDSIDFNIGVAQKQATAGSGWATFAGALNGAIGGGLGSGGQAGGSGGNGASFFNSKGSGVTFGPATNGGYGGHSSTVGSGT